MIEFFVLFAFTAVFFQIAAVLVLRIGLNRAIRSHASDRCGMLPALSVVIAVKNEANNLAPLLDAIAQQDYPNAEVLFVDDGSTDGTREVLQAFALRKPNVRIVQTKSEHRKRLNGKKAALQTGIEAAKHDLLVFTDGDCWPQDVDWLKRFGESFNAGAEVVVGTGLYLPSAHVHSRCYASETIRVSAMYHAAVGLGMPYMCVGRSMGYTRPAFIRSGGFDAHPQLPSGSDDLLLQTFTPGTVICACPSAVTFSKPPVSLSDWLHQKKRHLGSAPLYPPVVKGGLVLYDCTLLLMPLVVVFAAWIGGMVMLVLLSLLVIRTLLSASNFQSIKNLAGRHESLSQLWCWEYPASWLNALISIASIWKKEKAWKNDQ
ncbi:MAG: glycosyltransferase [Cryomorphaceae bacterium]